MSCVNIRDNLQVSKYMLQKTFLPSSKMSALEEIPS